jgi:hypothetical protein
MNTTQPTTGTRRRIVLIVCLGVLLLSTGFTIWWFAFRPVLSASDTPEQIAEKIFAAHGGQPALDRWRSGRVCYEALEERGDPTPLKMTITETFRLPRLWRLEQSGFIAGRDVKVVFLTDGKHCWLKEGRGHVLTSPLPTDALRIDCPHYIQDYHPRYLLGTGEEMSVRGIETRPDGSRDLVLEVPGWHGKTLECRADVRTGLVRAVRGELRSPVYRDLIDARYEYTDYQKTAGGTVPGLITGYIGDRKLVEIRLLSHDLDVTLADSVFAPLTLDTD